METLSKSDLEAILTNKLGERKFELISYETRDIKDISQGLVSSIAKLAIYYKVQNVTEKCSIFMKIQGTTHAGELTATFFQREEDVYNIFLMQLSPDINGFFPACFLAKNKVLVLEDISVNGFKNLNILDPCDFGHCLKVADCLVRLHAGSFACEISKRRKLSELIPELERELIFSKEENHPGRRRHLVGVKALRNFAEVYLPQYPDEVVRKAFDFLTAIPEKLDPSTKYPNVLCHSDLWNNNIMFSYKSNGEVSKACLIDFQMASYRPPTFDLQLFMHCCTNQNIRREHTTHIKKYYFQQLQECLRQADINPEDIMTSEMFEDMYEDTLPIVLGLAPQFMHFVGTPVEFLRPIMEDRDKWKHYYEEDRDDFVLRVALESLAYRTKVIEGLEDFFEYFMALP